MPVLSFDFRQWKGGASSSRFSSERGFSSASVGVDLISRPGLLLPGATLTGSGWAGTQLSNVLDAGIIAACSLKTVTDRQVVAITANGSADGRVLRMTGNTEAVLYASDSGRNYERGISSIIEYKGGIFWTSHTDIALAADYDWGSTIGLGNLLTANKPHPMCVHGDFLVIADGNYIHLWDGTTGSWQALDLPDTYTIFDVESHAGKLYIAATQMSFAGNPYTSDMGYQSAIFTWDTVLPSWIDEWPVEEKVLFMRSYKDTLCVWTPTRFGQFLISRISPIYPLHDFVYKHETCVAGDALWFKYPTYAKRAGSELPDYLYTNATAFDRVACYTSLDRVSPPVITFPIISSFALSGDGIRALVPFGLTQQTILAAFWKFTATDYFRQIPFPQSSPFSIAATSDGYDSCVHEENVVIFPQTVNIRRMTVILSGTRPTGQRIEIGFRDQDYTYRQGMILSDANHTGSHSVHTEDMNPVVQVSAFHLNILPYVTSAGANSVCGVLRVIVEYEPIDGKLAR